MKQLLSLFSILFLINSVKGQSNNTLYQTLLAEAGLLHLQKDYKKAIITYEKAFKLEQPNALTAYKLAGVYSLDSNANKAFFYLELALNTGWTEADWLAEDYYFDYLKNTAPNKWEIIKQQALLKEKEYEKTLKLPALRKQINLIAINDQKLRYKRIQTKDKNQRKLVNQAIHKTDSTNLVQAKAIINKYGWPKLSEIGKDGQNNFWLMVQHADGDVIFQQKALNAMKKLKKSNEINLENYAFLYDRVQCNLNFKQLYGTQVNWVNNGKATSFRPILNEDLVDKRRKEIGLLPLRIYSLTYGFEYNNLTAAQAYKNDSTDLAYTKQLIDSANYFYTKSDFQKTYNYYNTASTVLGGMSNKDNYNAAIIFAKISSQNNEQQYKDIALDFLNLLYQRQALSKTQLKKEHEFKVLYKEHRWIDLYEHVK